MGGAGSYPQPLVAPQVRQVRQVPDLTRSELPHESQTWPVLCSTSLERAPSPSPPSAGAATSRKASWSSGTSSSSPSAGAPAS